MKRTKTDRPTISFCMIVRDASKTLETTLKSIRALTPEAEICIVDTMSGDGGLTEAIAKTYADVWIEWTGPEGKWTRDMVAFDDAAAARNKSFELANGKWLGWIDADDELAGPELAQRLLSANGYLVPGRTDVEGEKKGELNGTPVLTFESFLEAAWADGQIEGFYAPYLYRFKKGDDGTKLGKAEEWQVRERIVRCDARGATRWSWRRKAHEVLVPDDSSLHGRMVLLSTLLFVHRKEWSDEDIKYTVDRHYAIVKKEYDAGGRDFFDLYYLCTYAPQKAPELREQFLADYLAAASTPGERARAHHLRGQYLLGEGYFLETLEAFQAGVLCDPTLADNHFGMAAAYQRADRWLKAAESYAAGCAQPPIHPFARTPPREHTVVNRVLGAIAFWNAWKNGAGAVALENAVAMVKAALEVPGVQLTDGTDLACWLRLFENEHKGVKVMEGLVSLHDFLVRNDETAKAAQLVHAIPHNMEDTPEAAKLRTFARKIERHATDATSYQDFYTQNGTDKATTEEGIEESAKLTRVQFVNQYLKLLREQVGRPLKVLEIGTWDGITLLPSMKELPDSTFVGIEASAKAMDRLRERAKARGWSERFHGIQGLLSPEKMREAQAAIGDGCFDAIIFCEVIEHIVDPTEALDLIYFALAPKHGRLFISTPWGAFDRGHSADAATRDPRGHVHAYTPRALHDLLTTAGFRILEMNGDWGMHAEGNFGDTQVLMAEIEIEHRLEELVKPELVKKAFSAEMNGSYWLRRPCAPQFVVPAALWPWNASMVEQTGMGASEETIVYLARELGREGGAPSVYGPLPKLHTLDASEVRDGVAYWPNAQAVDWLNPKQPVVVSRSPAYGVELKRQMLAAGRPAPERMFLWLQDTYYPDLNPAVANEYERIVVLSHWHREALAATSKIPLEKFKVIPNFILKEHFPDVPSKVAKVLPREPHRLIYCSSPDRGLLPLLRMWPQIRRRWPDATLGIYYGWEGAVKLASVNPAWTRQYRALRSEYSELVRAAGVQFFGRVNHGVIANEMRRASVWAYPIIDGRASVETFCSNAVKARAAGCVPVTVPEAALKETARSGITQFVEWNKGLETDLYVQYPGELVAAPGLSHFQRSFIDAIGKAFEATEIQRDTMAEEAIATYELARVLPMWKELLGA